MRSFRKFPKKFGEARETWGAGPRASKIRIPNRLAPEIGPGLLLLATPQIRLPGARNPHAGGPFGGVSSEVAEILEISRNLGITAIPGIPKKPLGGRGELGGPILRLRK